MLIGLTGKNGSGKGEVAKFLKERGFECCSLSDVVRAETRKRKKTITRKNLIATGNLLREKHGAGVLAEKLLSCLDIDRHYVIDSIRHPAEVKTLRSRKGFVLFEIKAPAKERFNRIKARQRENDPLTLKEFNRIERIESKSRVRSDQQLSRTLRLADHHIANAGSLDELHDAIAKLVMKVAKKKERPSWDDYFLGIARVVALRSNCVKRKVAAVIVKDKRIISTGYNGTPRGVPNCNEGGCERCNSFTRSGVGLTDCLCSHGEENAITQAAYHGVSIKGATIYTTFSPCLLCTKMIINSGLQEVVFNVQYPLGNIALKLLRQAGVLVRKLKV